MQASEQASAARRRARAPAAAVPQGAFRAPTFSEAPAESVQAVQPEPRPREQSAAVTATAPAGVGRRPRSAHPKSYDQCHDAKNDRSVDMPAVGNRIGKHGKANVVEVRVRTTIFKVTDVNVVDQTFTVNLFIEASWVDAALLDENGVCREVDAAATKQKRGKLCAIGDEEHYYFTPQLDLLNLAESKDFDEFWETYKTRDKKAAVVCWQAILKGAVFQTRFHMQAFPLDTQSLEIQLQSAWPNKYVNLVRNMKHEYRSVIQDVGILSHEYAVSKLLHMMPKTSAKEDSGSGTSRSCLRIQMRVRRLPFYWIMNVWLPLFFFTGVSFASFAVEVTALSNRLSVCITILLTLVAYRFSIMDKLPNVDRLTYLDYYVQTCFAVVLATTVHAVSLAVRAESSLPELAIDNASLVTTWSNPISWQGSQRTALLACCIAWIGVNAAVPTGLLLLRYFHKSSRERLRWWDTELNAVWLGGVVSTSAKDTTDDEVVQLQGCLNDVLVAKGRKPSYFLTLKSILRFGNTRVAIVEDAVADQLRGSTKQMESEHSRRFYISASDALSKRMLPKIMKDVLPESKTSPGWALLEFKDAAQAQLVVQLLEEARAQGLRPVKVEDHELHKAYLALNAWLLTNWNCDNRSEASNAAGPQEKCVVEIALPEYKCLLSRPWWDKAPEPAGGLTPAVSADEAPATPPSVQAPSVAEPAAPQSAEGEHAV